MVSELYCILALLTVSLGTIGSSILVIAAATSPYDETWYMLRQIGWVCNLIYLGSVYFQGPLTSWPEIQKPLTTIYLVLFLMEICLKITLGLINWLLVPWFNLSPRSPPYRVLSWQGLLRLWGMNTTPGVPSPTINRGPARIQRAMESILRNPRVPGPTIVLSDSPGSLLEGDAGVPGEG